MNEFQLANGAETRAKASATVSAHLRTDPIMNLQKKNLSKQSSITDRTTHKPVGHFSEFAYKFGLSNFTFEFAR